MRRIALLFMLASLAAVACFGDGQNDDLVATVPLNDQHARVQALIERSSLIQVACLDVNGDGRVDAGDADSDDLPDISGDGAVDDIDRDVVRAVDFALSEDGSGCADGPITPDWQVTLPATPDCDSGEPGVVIVGGGGGGPDPERGLDDPSIGAGLRWIVDQIAGALAAQGVASQVVALTPGFNGTEGKALDAEVWALAYLHTVLARSPCLRVVLIGHSFGGAMVESIATRLEENGLGERIVLTVLVDSINALYPGTAEAMPQTSSVLNVYQTNDSLLRGPRIAQPNVENWDASDELAPEFGDSGGDLVPVVHTNIDNSQGVADRVRERTVERSCSMGLC